MRFFKASLGALSVVTAVLVLLGVSAAVAALPKATTLGVSASPAASDGQSAIVVGTGADMKIFRDDRKAPIPSPTKAGCVMNIAAAGTGLVQCSIARPTGPIPSFRLVSMSTGADRPLPGASAISSPIASPIAFAMGSQWIAATICPEHCRTLAIQWHTGASKPFEYSTRHAPQTALSSPALKPSISVPSVSVEGDKLVYRRGTFNRSFVTRYAGIMSVKVTGWRVAWLTQDPPEAGGKLLEVNVLNAKTGKRVQIPFSRFGAPASSLAPDSRYPMKLQVTAKRLALSFPTAANPDGYTVTTLPWPV